MNEPVRQPVYVFEGLRLDAQRRVLFGADGEPLTLTPRLFDTLLYFVERAGQLLTKEQLLEALWPDVVVEEHNLNKTVSELRRVLGEKPGEHRFIVTKPGRGYRFVAGVSVASSSAANPGQPRSDQGARANDDAASALAPNAPPPTLTRRATRNRAYWAAAALGAGAVVVGAALLGFFNAAPDPQLRTTPLSVEKGGQWSPRWSPDGREIAFVARGSANEPAQIYVRALDEPAARLIGRGPLPIPAIAQWTTAGKILFWHRNGLWAISPVGVPPEHLVALDTVQLGMGAPMSSADVTRDGATMATVARGDDGVFGIWTATLPSANLERYDPAPFSANAYHNAPFLRFSPDGRRLLLFWYAADRGEEAWLMPFPPDASSPPRRILARLPAVVATPTFSWLPDNRRIVVSTGPELQRALYLADTRSGEFALLSAGTGDQTNPVVSPDGSKLAVTDVRRDFDIVTLDLGTATVKRLIETDRAEIFPSWAGDTEALVYVTDRSGMWEIWLHEPPQPDRPLVTAADSPTTARYLIAPTLSPDASHVIYQRVEAPGDTSRLWMVAVASGAAERLTDEEVTEVAGSWSPDGAWYVYLTYGPEGGSKTLKRVRTTGQAAPETLLEGLKIAEQLGQEDPLPVWSPDGDWILVSSGGRILLVAADGKTTRDLGLESAVCAFARNEDLLHCILGRALVALEPLRVVAIDFDGKIVRAIGSLPPEYMPHSAVGPGSQLSPTPDGTGLTYSIGSGSETLWLMEGLDEVALP